MSAGCPLYLRHSEAIERAIRIACSALGLARAEAQDFMQDARIHLLQSEERVLRHFRGESSLITYLLVDLTRFSRRWTARASKRNFQPREEFRHGIEATGQIIQQDRIAQMETARLIRSAVKRVSLTLSSTDLALLALRYAHARTWFKLAEQLGLSRTAADKRIARAKAAIRREFAASGISCVDLESEAGLAVLDSLLFRNAPRLGLVGFAR